MHGAGHNIAENLEISLHIISLIICAKELMRMLGVLVFACLYVHWSAFLFVCEQFNTTFNWQMFIKLIGNVRNDTRMNWFNFRSNLYHFLNAELIYTGQSVHLSFLPWTINCQSSCHSPGGLALCASSDQSKMKIDFSEMGSVTIHMWILFGEDLHRV